MRLLTPLLALLSSLAAAQASEIIGIELEDGEVISGKLHLPSDVDRIEQVVIFVHGTGPNTYLNKRKFGPFEFNYYDMFGQELSARGIAMFAYNKRGVTIGTNPPMFEEIDREKFKRVVPSVDVKDLEVMIGFLRADERLKQAKVVLLGWSEGTIIASMVAEKKENRIEALLLAGYAHDNMADIIKWQLSGKPSMSFMLAAFEQDADGKISREEYESENASASQARMQFGDSPFDTVDFDGDGFVTTNDFKVQLDEYCQSIFDHIESGDEDWIWNNYFHVSLEWLVEHFDLEPNKQRLLRLDLPIYVFHGEADSNVPASGVRDLMARFAKAGKTNLHPFFFEAHAHDLNFLQWVTEKKQSAGVLKIFEVAESLDAPAKPAQPEK